MARPRIRADLVLRLEVHDVRHAQPAPVFLARPHILDITRRPPQVPDIARPQPRLRAAPLAQTEHDRPARRLQRIPHRRIRRHRILRPMLAPVVLQIIHAPRRILARVLKLIPAAPRPALTSLRPRIRIQPELQPLPMHIVRERLHPRREVLRIGDDVALRIARHLPAIVDHEILIARVTHPARHHLVRGLAYQLLTHIASKLVPTVPTHRRGLRQSVVQPKPRHHTPQQNQRNRKPSSHSPKIYHVSFALESSSLISHCWHRCDEVAAQASPHSSSARKTEHGLSPDTPLHTEQACLPTLLPHSPKLWLATPQLEVHCLSVVKELPPKANGAPEGAPLVRTSPYPNPTHPKSRQQENSAPSSYESNHQNRTKVTSPPPPAPCPPPS